MLGFELVDGRHADYAPGPNVKLQPVGAIPTAFVSSILDRFKHLLNLRRRQGARRTQTL
jgi:hypothetical protein